MTDAEHPVAKAFAYYSANQEEIVAGHVDEYVVIKDNEILGYYKIEEEAFRAMSKETLGTFIVQKCKVPGTDIENYYNNAVVFV